MTNASDVTPFAPQFLMKAGWVIRPLSIAGGPPRENTTGNPNAVCRNFSRFGAGLPTTLPLVKMRRAQKAVHCLVELEVDRPDVMRIFRAQQLPTATGRPRALAPAMQGPLEPFLTPDPLHSLVIDAPAIKPQPPVDEAPG
jgi:hypothetical protein